ncbi:MAG: HAD hydrolase-like protein [Candidatus Dojkabacteria bacterium]|nr:HAD hydrolase-like protein [Candidatus Dojkabacteria bacterium]MDQ7020572.1 HAD hydrolase-like protein [Candidatus Dojkabacteria bacterium]
MGFKELLNKVSEKYTLAIASTASVEEINSEIFAFELATEDINPFSVIVSGMDVQNNTPAPDVYLKCSELLDIPKEETVVIEDSLSGGSAAKAAGLYCLARASEFVSREEHIENGADFVFEDYEEIIVLLETNK